MKHATNLTERTPTKASIVSWASRHIAEQLAIVLVPCDICRDEMRERQEAILNYFEDKCAAP